MSDISSVKQTGELTGSISKINMQKDDAKAALQDLFGETYFNGGQDSIDDINKEIAALEKQIDGWEKKLKDLESQIKDLEGNIKEKSDELVDVISNINDETRKFEQQQKAYIDEAITNAVNRTKSKNNPPQINTTFEEEFRVAIAGMPVGSTVIDALYGEQGVLNGLVETLFGKLDNLANQTKGIVNEVSNVKATINLLGQTKDNMSAKVGSLYKNTNNDTKIPVYSYEKESYIAQLAQEYGLNVKERGTGQTVNDGKVSGRDTAKIATITAQIAALGKVSAGNGDRYAAGNGNQMMTNLGKAVFGDNPGAKTVQEGSLVWQMAEAGASNIEIMDALASAFGGIGISGKDGKYSIPYGHGDGTARRIYSAVTSIANNTSGMPEPVEPPAGDAKQLQQASEIVDKLAKAGFTFKEAMFALDELLPDLDIGYSLGEQSGTKQGVVRFSSNTSYTPLAEQIRSYTKAGGVWQDSQVIQELKTENKPVKPSRTDPISVKDGNNRYYFMADDGNGKYDGVSDMLGYENGMADFETKYGQYITTGADGSKVITGDALNNIMVMRLEEIDNGDGSVGVKQSFMSAADAGITEINLSSAQQSGEFNINNSEIQNTFTVKMNGQTKVAEQALEDDEYLEATLNNDKLTGANLFSQLSDDAITKAWTDAENEVASNSSYQYLKGILDDLDNYKQGILDYINNGLQYSEEEFKEMIERRKEEADFILETAAKEGDTVYNNIQAQYRMDLDGDVPAYRFGGSSSGAALNEVIQDKVKDKIQEKYETFGMTDAEWEQHLKDNEGKIV